MSAAATPCILVVSDDATDAGLVKDLLDSQFQKVMVSTLPERATEDFDAKLPSVLVLAFAEVEKAERYYLGLYRFSTKVHTHPHRTVILCGNADLKRVSALCVQQQFDDYVLFWPMNHDAPRLPMTIHLALRALESRRDSGFSDAQVAAQARRLTELEEVLDRRLLQGSEHVKQASQAIRQAGAGIHAGLGSESPAEVGRHLHAAAESLRPLETWVGELQQASAPRKEAIQTLNASCSGARPIVLVVDDDEFQRMMITKLLDRQKFLVLCADSAASAFGMLRKTRPDVILMDMHMPDINGLQALKRLKGIPHFATIPVLMLTGKSYREAVIESVKAGACDFIVKPTDAPTLMTKLDRAMNGKGPGA